MSADLSQMIHARARLLHHHVQAGTGCVVAAGPFAGMTLVPDTSWGAGDIAAKLLGHYEAELHPVIENFAAVGFDEIYNVGCAEGFYAIGLSLRCPGAHVFAFDSDPNAQRVCLANCRANGVEARVSVGGTCDPALLAAMMAPPARRLLVIDCEGYEAVLIDPAQVPGLAAATLLIECHDFVDRAITPTLEARLAPTHDLMRLVEGPRDPNLSPMLQTFNSFDRWLALCEFRPETMHWILATPKAG